MNAKTSTSILLTVVILGGITMGLGLVVSGVELIGWGLVVAAIIGLIWLWAPRQRAGNS